MKKTGPAVSPAALEKLFVKTGALLRGHFLLSSGLHSESYLQCALLLSQPRLASRLGTALARLCPKKPDLVLSPALGGIVVGQETARALGVRHYFCERENGMMSLRRGFSLKAGETAVVVEDVVTTGKSSQEVIDLARSRGARVSAVLSLVDRRGEAPGPTVPLHSLLRLEIPTYRSEDCLLCRAGKPFVKPGSRLISPSLSQTKAGSPRGSEGSRA